MRVHVIISGNVQGVGYRYFIKREAEKLGLTGYVCNLQDGGVEALFEGEREKIEEMVEKCKKGPFLSEVKNVEVKEKPGNKEFSDFQIII